MVMSVSKQKFFLALFLAVALSGCKIVSNKDLAVAKNSGQDSFDASAYVDQHWNDKALADFKSKAIDLDTLLPAIAEDPDKAGKIYGQRAGEGNPWTYEIKGVGKVIAVDTASRHAIMSLEVTTKSGPKKVDLQIGPVIFGTALRDALPSIHFGDFVNQIQYAQVSRALNDRVSEAVHKSFDPKDAVGKSFSFYAAATLTPGADTITATPVALEPASEAKP
jgi:predicted lipoprotein